ncbi:hypothetical protein I6M53_18325 [Shewanella algae]|uniref:hypothetical protein n=1 Tax=Shewanella algae TaxID=38313 RepID=UPI001AAD53B3|nr:hypothetical protein [Shewanella algae]MBO2676588.1 hypothetical protein [Shewanella algae]
MLTQGSVFYGAYVHDYCNELCYGLLITARCDISQKKATSYSYLPLVSVESWFRLELPRILSSRISGSTYNNLITALENIGCSERVYNTYGIEKISQAYNDSNTKSKQLDKFRIALEKFELSKELNSNSISKERIKYITSVFKTETEKIISEVISQKLSGYYFVDDVSNDGPYIVKLRDVYHLSPNIALDLKKGIKIPEVQYPKEDDKSYTIGEINSPYIEHILQNFSSIFTRIGIDDPDKKLINKILEVQI